MTKAALFATALSTLTLAACGQQEPAPAPPPAGMAMATGAAALTPHFSSSSLESSAASRTVSADRSSTILARSAIVSFPSEDEVQRVQR